MVSVWSGSKPISFLFLGETLLIPHLYPIMEALAQADPHTVIEAWTSTQTHEVLLGRWLAESGIDHVRLRRAPGWLRTNDPERGINPELPAKLPLLARLAPRLLSARAVVCAEQTSMWIPRIVRFMPPFVMNSHGAGTINARDDPRQRFAALKLVPSLREQETFLIRGFLPERCVVTGYVKSGFKHLSQTHPLFTQMRPVVLYNPHWQEHRSSWWAWGERTVADVLACGRYNLIFAPHQRLVEKVPGLRALCESLSRRDDAICDIDSFAAVDGSYPHTADIYLGDTSSQMFEFVSRPRPAVFLDPLARDWKGDPSLEMWRCGPVVTDPEAILPTIEQAVTGHSAYAEVQRELSTTWLGATDGSGPDIAAAAILQFLVRLEAGG